MGEGGAVMPELPDLTLFAENLSKHVVDREIVSVEVHNAFKVNATSETFAAMAVGERIREITRNGKELFFVLSGGKSFCVHLMLSGRFSLVESQGVGAIPSKVLAVGLADDRALTVSDPMRMANVHINPKLPKAPDILSDKFTLQYFLRVAGRNEWENIKALLVGQKHMRGIGNAYADEILYASGISPECFTGRIPEEKLIELYGAIRDVSLDAIEQLRRLTPDAIAGEERSFLKVHNKNKQVTDEGEPIIVKKITGKTTYFTQAQVLYR
jgi:formamidopyrimidine-DNA glycosylase